MPESRRQNEWTEGLAIWIAVIVVSCVGEFACLDTCSPPLCCSLLVPCEHLCRSNTVPLFPRDLFCLSSQLALVCLGAQPSPSCPAACAWCSSTCLPVLTATTSMQCGLCHNVGRLNLLQALPLSGPRPKCQHHKPSMNPTCCAPAVGARNDYQKDKQFRELNAKKDELKIKVVRDGKEFLIPNTEIVVGDLLKLETGDKIAADGLCVESHNLVVDEASLTGEIGPLKKGQEDPFVRACTQVGSARGAYMNYPAETGHEEGAEGCL